MLGLAWHLNQKKGNGYMDVSKALWLDLRSIRDQISCSHYLNEDWTVFRICNTERLDLEIHKITPTLLCFELDYPNISSLSALRQARCSFPSIPIIMITEQHSEALAIWALRIRVWDYLVKPLQPKELVTSAAAIQRQEVSPIDKTSQLHQRFNLFSNPIPTELRFRSNQEKKTLRAQYFIEAHLNKRICEDEVAQLCGMNTSAFSRSFKEEHKITFRDYLINSRVSKARELLQNPNASVTDIAYTVGFKDPSYFTRTFRRIVGMSPSRYREIHKLH